MNHAYIICNSQEDDLGVLEYALASYGFVFDYLDRASPWTWPPNPRADLFVHLGSSWSVYWGSVQQNVEAEIALVRRAAKLGIPVLGICFGAQVLSTAFGGVVEKAPKPEVGWSEVRALCEDSVLSGTWMQWHYDSFTAPFGFEVLAVNDCGVQAITRDRMLGLQFHPEVNESVVTQWISGDGSKELAALGISPSDLLEETRLNATRVAVATQELVDWFIGDISTAPFSSGGF